MRANIEGDELLYRAAFSVQKTGYILINKKGVKYDLKANHTATQIKDFYSAKNKVFGDDYTLQEYALLSPESTIALHRAKSLIKRWVYKIKEHCPDFTVWITSQDRSNFRYEVAKTSRVVAGREILGYKEGRAPRPILYEPIREYLIKKFGAVEVYGMEADDALGIHKGLMVHMDKDINMIPGEHLNWVSDDRYNVPEDGLGYMRVCDSHKMKFYGKLAFYIQLLVGDSTDNIPGIQNPFITKNCNFGPSTAYNYLKDCTTERELFDKVYEVYYIKYNEHAILKLSEIADLVWILQTYETTGSVYIKQFI